ncbi:MAG: hypothetical protein DWQ07_17520 [Chloroflexi bacterium]|nr:MAG: hypothetical protein DWQ07_17520 [Chloroflexota bacterium]
MLDELNEMQLKAATYTLQPLLVVAGPGTGKSKLLTARVWHLVQEERLASRGIYVITFTRKARANMQSRLEEALSHDQAQHINVLTIDALAYRILQAQSRQQEDNIARRPTVASEHMTHSLFLEAIEELAWRDPQISRVQAWETMRNWKLGDRDPALLPDGLAPVVGRFQELLIEAHKWDIADLLPLASQVLSGNREIAAAFYTQAMLIDEFQDTTLAQYCFIRQVMEAGGGNVRNFTAVGAEAQSIYGWRNANYLELREHIEEDYPDLHRIKLDVNYRSRGNVSAAAAAMAPTYEEVYLNCLRDGGDVYLHQSQTEEQEAQLFADMIQRLCEDGLPYQDLAILVRTWKQATVLEKALLQARLPYSLASEAKLPYYKRPAVLALIGYLRAVAALRADQVAASDYDMQGALGLILNMPPRRGIGPVSREMILDGQAELGWEQLTRAMVREDLRPQVRASCQELFDILTGLARDRALVKPNNIIEAVLERTQWLQSLHDELNGKELLTDLQALQSEAVLFETLEGFLDSLRTKLGQDWNNAGVTISTVHAAKGLEWPVVFIASFNDKIMPHASAMKSQRQMSEEERIAHVAFSRARDLLFISYVNHMRDANTGEYQQMQVSRFAGRLANIERRTYEQASFGLDPGSERAGRRAPQETAHPAVL